MIRRYGKLAGADADKRADECSTPRQYRQKVSSGPVFDFSAWLYNDSMYNPSLALRVSLNLALPSMNQIKHGESPQIVADGLLVSPKSGVTSARISSIEYCDVARTRSML